MVGAKYSLITFPPTLHISLETTLCVMDQSGSRARLIEIFINISLPDIYPQQKQESKRVFQDENKSYLPAALFLSALCCLFTSCLSLLVNRI